MPVTKSMLIVLCVVSLAAQADTTTTLTATNTVCDDAAKAAMDELSNNGLRIYDSTLQQPEPSAMEKCLNGIMGSTGHYNIPGLGGADVMGQLMQKACQAIQSQVSSTTSGMDYNFNTGVFGTVSAGLQSGSINQSAISNGGFINNIGSTLPEISGGTTNQGNSVLSALADKAMSLIK